MFHLPPNLPPLHRPPRSRRLAQAVFFSALAAGGLATAAWLGRVGSGINQPRSQPTLSAPPPISEKPPSKTIVPEVTHQGNPSAVVPLPRPSPKAPSAGRWGWLWRRPAQLAGSSDSAWPVPPNTNPENAIPPTPGPIVVPPLPPPTADLAARSRQRLVQPPRQFSDVPPGHWAGPALNALSSRGLVSGFPDGRFGPEQPMSRAELAAQISLVFGPLLRPEPADGPALSWSDVEPQYWAAESIRRAVQLGFLSGVAGGQFEPERPVSRVELISAIASGLKLNSTAAPEPVLRRYRDRAEIPAWAAAAVVATTEVGLVAPVDNQLAPNRPAGRAEVAALMHQALVYLGQVDALSAPAPPLP